MVENKKTKREKDIKSKLLAAVAMLLVSSIMMVSTTYAWFTLSTAPEVTGITTTIGANGNLEIALSPRSGVASEVGDATLNTTTWDLKNLTWGNLVDMNYDGKDPYGLGELTLAPAQLAANGDATNGYTLNASAALATPSYGSDGRISGLNANAAINGKALNATGYATVDADYGVRAVGTSSGMSAQQSKFKNSVNAIGTYANNAITAASNSLSQNGNALASMLVQHAKAGEGSDNNDYAKYVPALVEMTAQLENAITAIDDALISALIAAACQTAEETLFNGLVKSLEEAADINAAVTILNNNNIAVPEGLTAIITQRNNLATKITNANTAANGLVTQYGVTVAEDGTVSATGKIGWTEVSPVLTSLMNTGGNIRISGYTISDIKAKMNDMQFLLGLANDCVIQLGYNSGVYYDLARIAGNVTAFTSADVEHNGIAVTLDKVTIKTVFPDGTADAETLSVASLITLKNAINTNVKPAGATGGAVLDAYYGYVVDLMVRTNAADSKLYLQTVPAQRVYEDSANANTMGKGATIVFTVTGSANAASVNDLIKSIRVVFFDPTNANKILGLAKVTSVVTSETEIEVTVDGTATTAIQYTITGSLELCEMLVSNNVADGATLFEAGEVKTDVADTDLKENQVLCNLTQNVPQAISAMVYLDGNNVTSADVLADENLSGVLNLQFSSSADLKPMENSALRNGTGTNP